MSGRSNIIWWLKNNGYQVTDELVEHMFSVAKKQRKLMEDEEIHNSVRNFNQK